MKWYFAMSQASIDRADHDWRGLIRVALASAKANTALVPYMLYDGEPSKFTDELERSGVTIIRRRISFYDEIAHYSRDNPWHAKIAGGAFLRIEIPEVEKDDQFVLYTDCDVQFLKQIQLDDCKPSLFSAAPQSNIGDYYDLNSGVMVINVAGMAKDLPQFKEFIVANLHLGLDQEMLAAFYRERYDVLAPEYNWKPYWGRNDDCRIVHWHGPKPVVARLRVENPAHGTGVHVWDRLLEKDIDSYRFYVETWDRMNEDALSSLKMHRD